MKIINAGFEILDGLDASEILKKIELCGRVCYKSEANITSETAANFVRGIINNGHESVLEHVSFSVRFIVDRGVSHELVRHRIASFSQESTRYCNYNNDNGGCTFIKPLFFDEQEEAAPSKATRYHRWKHAMQVADRAYANMIASGATPQEARSVLPNSLKTEVIMTCNLREWRHMLKLRTAKAAHPQMREVSILLLNQLKGRIPVIFDDIEVE